MKRDWRLAPSEVISLLVIGATKKRGAGIDTENTGGSGSFTVKITDSPTDYESLDITVNKVEAYHQRKGWLELDNKSRSFNVLNLTGGAEAIIAHKAQAETGIYTRLRITFAQDARLKLDSGTVGGIVALNWENNMTKVEVEIHTPVEPGENAEVLLNFNTAASVKVNRGRYSLQPVITEIKNPGTGARGRIMSVSSVTLVLTDGKMHYTTNTDAQGNFLFRGIKEGVYKLIITPERYTVSHHSVNKEINGVIIIENELKQMGEISL